MNVFVSHSYFLHFDPKQLRLSKPYPPLATLLACAVIREAGHQVHFYDVSFDDSTRDFKNALKHTKPDLLVIYDDGFNYLTKMCLSNMRDAALDMIAYAASLHVPSVISSSDSTDHFDFYLTAGASGVMLGEAEETLKEVLHAFSSGNTFDAIKGLVCKHGNDAINNGRRPVLRDLDQLPFAAWDLLSIVPYKKAWNRHGYFSMNMATTRGCPFKCNWCAKPIYGNRYNTRSAQKVAEELAWMKALFSFDHIWFCDDIFGLKPGWVNQFRESLNNQHLSFRFKIQSRADLLLEGETLDDLKACGCDEVWIGAESGSQKVLDAMDKGITVEQIRTASLGMKDRGMKPCFFLQFGYPGETLAEINQTLQMVSDLNPYDMGVSVSYPLPGTVFYDRVKNELKDKQNWTDSDELLTMYRAAYPSEFYKSLHRFLHKKYRLRQWTNREGAEGNNTSIFQRMMRVLYYRYGLKRERNKMKQWIGDDAERI